MRGSEWEQFFYNISLVAGSNADSGLAIGDLRIMMGGECLMRRWRRSKENGVTGDDGAVEADGDHDERVMVMVLTRMMTTWFAAFAFAEVVRSSGVVALSVVVLGAVMAAMAAVLWGLAQFRKILILRAVD